MPPTYCTGWTVSVIQNFVLFCGYNVTANVFVSFLEMITALQKQETNQNYESDLIKLSEKLGKVLTEADIRLLIDGLLQKNGAEMYASKKVLFFVYFK